MMINDYPANRLDVARVAGLYWTWEIRNNNVGPMRWFRTLNELISHARHYAGMVWAAPNVYPELQSAGLLLVRNI